MAGLAAPGAGYVGAVGYVKLNEQDAHLSARGTEGRSISIPIRSPRKASRRTRRPTASRCRRGSCPQHCPLPSDTWLLICHGNLGSIGYGGRPEFYASMRDLGINLLAFDYRGFGESDGAPDERGLYDDATASYQYLTRSLGVPPDRMIALWTLSRQRRRHRTRLARAGRGADRGRRLHLDRRSRTGALPVLSDHAHRHAAVSVTRSHPAESRCRSCSCTPQTIRSFPTRTVGASSRPHALPSSSSTSAEAMTTPIASTRPSITVRSRSFFAMPRAAPDPPIRPGEAHREYLSLLGAIAATLSARPHYQFETIPTTPSLTDTTHAGEPGHGPASMRDWCAQTRTTRHGKRPISAHSSKDLHMASTTGTIKRITDKGFGFIATPDGTEYFFHQSACTSTPFDSLREGEKRELHGRPGPEGPPRRERRPRLASTPEPRWPSRPSGLDHPAVRWCNVVALRTHKTSGESNTPRPTDAGRFEHCANH